MRETTGERDDDDGATIPLVIVRGENVTRTGDGKGGKTGQRKDKRCVVRI